jgi:hypothetical protein
MPTRRAAALAAALTLLAPAAFANSVHAGHGAIVNTRLCPHAGRHGCLIVRRHRSGVEVHAFQFPVETPRDSASGHATGRRMHKPIVH